MPENPSKLKRPQENTRKLEIYFSSPNKLAAKPLKTQDKPRKPQKL